MKWSLGWLGLAPKKWNKAASNFLTGKEAEQEQRSLLSPEQQKLQQQLEGAISGQGAGGAFGDVADYYRGLLGNDSADFQAFAAPELRNFREQILPGIAEQFAGMGAGGLTSSGFQNSSVGAGADLSERLGALRAQLRQSGAAGLQGLGQFGLRPTVENIERPAQPGLLESFAQPAATAVGTAFGGPVGGAIGNAVGSFASNAFKAPISGKGQSGPYGGPLKSGGGINFSAR